MKTNNEILTFIYKEVVASPLNDLSGDVYKGVRPTDSDKEDVVISLITGIKGQFVQDCSVFVKVFYSDVQLSEDTNSEDFARSEIIEGLLFDLSELLFKNNSGYSFVKQTREIYSAPVDEGSDINQHYIILKINLKTK